MFGRKKMPENLNAHNPSAPLSSCRAQNIYYILQPMTAHESLNQSYCQGDQNSSERARGRELYFLNLMLCTLRAQSRMGTIAKGTLHTKRGVCINSLLCSQYTWQDIPLTFVSPEFLLRGHFPRWPHMQTHKWNFHSITPTGSNAPHIGKQGRGGDPTF